MENLKELAGDLIALALIFAPVWAPAIIEGVSL